MSGSCHCGGNADACAAEERHTGPDGAPPAGPSPYYVGRCSRCGRWASIPKSCDECETCARRARREYFESDEARELARSILGT